MPPGQKLGSFKQKRPSSSWNLQWIFKSFLCSVVFFYLGVLVGWAMDQSCNCANNDSGNLRAGRSGDPSGGSSEGVTEEAVHALKNIGESVEEHKKNEEKWAIKLNDMKKKLEEQEETMKKMEMKEHRIENDEKSAVKLNEMKTKLEKQKQTIMELQAKKIPHHQDLFFSRHTGNFVSGMEFVDRNSFASVIDTGVPLDKSGWANDQVLLLYSDKLAMPDKKMHTDGSEVLSVEDATKNCRNLHVVLTSEGRKQQCIAVMAQFESFHLQKFMRMADSESQKERVIDMNLPLRSVNRNMQINGEKAIAPPLKKHSEAFWKILTSYLNSLEGVLEELGPIAESVASSNQNNTIIVMVCNFGHSEMLMNFVCNAHAKGKETQAALSSVLVFPTDIETHKLAQSLGLKSFYSETIFGGTPHEAAEQYGDEVYSKIMLSKVYCVHLISQLGYDLLFQDVDIVWYKNPLPFFYIDLPDKNSFYAKEWDMIFQDDGARHLFFAPYSANTGFYFVRNNRKTQYFFNQLLMTGDLILSTGSHQSTLIVLLSEQASLYGLKIKTWNREADEFPGGFSYHQRKDWMKKLVLSKNSTEGKGLVEIVGDKVDAVDPYIFHMSWTLNKDNKLKYFEQMGEWYVKDECNKSNDKFQNDMLQNPTINSCCTAKPLIRCHYKDKPSIIPCPDSPSVDLKPKPKPSFW
jgi:hypothetical protein